MIVSSKVTQTIITIAKMTDEQLEKWNLRFCPKCRGHIRIGRTKSSDGQTVPIKYCQNIPTCDYKVFLSRDNIADPCWSGFAIKGVRNTQSPVNYFKYRA